MRGPVSLLKDAWGTFASNTKLFLGIYVVPAAIVLIWSVFVAMQGEETLFSTAVNILIATVMFLVLIVANIMMGIAMMKAVINPAGTTIGSAYGFAKQYFFPYVWVAILVGVVTMAGFALLIIPGILFAVWFAFSYFVLLVEGKRGVAAMKASKAYVKGKWWAVFGRYVFLIVIGILVSMLMAVVSEVVEATLAGIGAVIVSFAFNAVIVPVAIAYTYLMYKDLSGGSMPTPSASPSPTAMPPTAHDTP